MLVFFFFNELKYRIFYCFIFFIACFFLFLFFSKELIFIFVKPLLDINIKNTNFFYFIFTDMSQVFLLYVQVSFIVSLIYTFLFMFLQGMLFLIQGLYNYEKNLTLVFFILYIFLFILLFIFFYYYAIPFIWFFFINFELTSSNFIFGIYYEAHIKDYIFFLLSFFSVFLIILQLPFILIFLLYFNFLSVNILVNYRRYLIILTFIFGGFVTPPDIFSQFGVCIPILLLYEVIIFIELLFNNYCTHFSIKKCVQS